MIAVTTVLVTGANKGLGRGFVQKYLSRPDTVVVAAVRNPESEESKALLNLNKAQGSKLIPVKIESASATDALEAVESITQQGVSHLDIVIANAGIFKSAAFLEVSKMKSSDLLEHVDINVNGPVRLFQATLPLLHASRQPKFIAISSGVGTIGGAEYIPWAVTSYGASKAALNFLLRRIHIENKDLIAIAFHPGAVQTDEGNKAAQFFGFEAAFTSVEDSVDGIIAKVDAATREDTSGRFLAFDNTPLVW
ncbi:NAD(P)-binding protein [Aureobasidium pullulans]|uniref:NAD(P)-binding protein n=1 Tax=Aureobasidium pullulans TaxID=5580 RepID=A0A4S8XXS3_AURPU|nr:NAD(P)-binding protein [Aureobasidium pullulans]